MNKWEFKSETPSGIPKKLSKLLFPALGGPNIATLIPDRTISPLLESSRWFFIVAMRV
jgi:hypothetical protein